MSISLKMNYKRFLIYCQNFRKTMYNTTKITRITTIATSFSLCIWRPVPGSNRWPPPWQGGALTNCANRPKILEGLHGAYSGIKPFRLLSFGSFTADNTFPYPTGPTYFRIVTFVKPTQSRMGRFPSTLVLIIALVFGRSPLHLICGRLSDRLIQSV